MDLFSTGKIGSLEVKNRLVRSATAERLAAENGEVTPALLALHRSLAEGGVGLIITGHMYVHPGGKCHPEMTAIHTDDCLPGLSQLAQTIHSAGGKAVVQINHGGRQCGPETVPDPVCPSESIPDENTRAARALQAAEIEEIIAAYAAAARRAQQAGFDGVQIHAAHGYLINQFISPLTNRRTDRWGGSPYKRRQFLRDVAGAVRCAVGPDYPVLIKLGLVDGREGGLSLPDGLQVLNHLEDMGIDAIEISSGFSGPHVTSSAPGIKPGINEAYFRSWARQARSHTTLPLILVGGLRTQAMMQNILDGGCADFISLCRPLISEPDLPVRLQQGLQDRSICISGNRCWPDAPGVGIACKCKVDRSLRGEEDY